MLKFVGSHNNSFDFGEVDILIHETATHLINSWIIHPENVTVIFTSILKCFWGRRYEIELSMRYQLYTMTIQDDMKVAIMKDYINYFNDEASRRNEELWEDTWGDELKDALQEEGLWEEEEEEEAEEEEDETCYNAYCRKRPYASWNEYQAWLVGESLHEDP